MTNYFALGNPDLEIGLNPAPIVIRPMQILLITAIVCSSDTVAAVSIVDHKKQPKLFAIIFGEGVLNDIVSIILFNTVLDLQSQTFSSLTPLIILIQFVVLGLILLIIGLFFGLLTSFVFKHLPFLTTNAVTETFLLFAISMISYFVADMTEIFHIKMSGIISLLTCGIIQSHYTYWNMSP